MLLENSFSTTRIYFVIMVTAQLNRLAPRFAAHVINSVLSAKTLVVLPSDVMGDKKTFCFCTTYSRRLISYLHYTYV